METSDSPNDPDEATETSEKVGYRKPPRQTRYKPGSSGNPRGRPPGAKNRTTLVNEIASEVRTAKANKNSVRYTTCELVLITLRNQALKGDLRAGRLYEEMLKKYFPEPVAQRPGGFALLAERITTTEEWLELCKRMDELVAVAERLEPNPWKARIEAMRRKF